MRVTTAFVNIDIVVVIIIIGTHHHGIVCGNF
jgi:hypothetical protein